MRSLENVLKATESLETELLREKASGLGRTAERLEALLERCAEVEAMSLPSPLGQGPDACAASSRFPGCTTRSARSPSGPGSIAGATG